jgi:hypothetical protein
VDFDHSLGTAINKIREVLNDSAAEPRFVETVPRRGYRFIAPVIAVEQDPVPPTLLPAPPVRAGATHRSLYAVVGAGVAIAMFSAALIAANFHGWREKLFSDLPRQPVVNSIAVLPLLNLSNDPDQQFFADGMTDELITSLAQIGSLRVISSSRTLRQWPTSELASRLLRLPVNWESTLSSRAR